MIAVPIGIVVLLVLLAAARRVAAHPARVRARRGVPARALLAGQGAGAGDPRIPASSRWCASTCAPWCSTCRAQDVITRDNVSVKVNAVVYFRVVDPQKAVIQVENFLDATSQLAQTTLRAVLGKHELDELLAEREKLNLDIQKILDSADRRLGHQGDQRRDQARGPQRDHDPRDRPPGRGRARAARQGDPRRGRAAGLGEAGAGGRDPRAAAAGDAAALPARR